MTKPEDVGIVIDENIVGLWFLETIPGQQDWLCGLSELLANEKYLLNYRFRYSTGDQTKNPFDCGDRRSWTHGEVSGTRAYCLAAVRMTAKILTEAAERMGGGPLYEVVNDGDLKKFVETYIGLPFAWSRAAEGPE